MNEDSDDSCIIVSSRKRTDLDKLVAQRPIDLSEEEFVNKQRINKWTRSSTGGIEPIEPFSDNVSTIFEDGNVREQRQKSCSLSDKPRDLYGDRQQPVGNDQRDLSATTVANISRTYTHPESPYISPYFNANSSAEAQEPPIELTRANKLPTRNQLVPDLPISSRNCAESQHSHPPNPFRYNALRPSRGTSVGLEDRLRNDSALPTAQTSSPPVSRINPPPHASLVPVASRGGIKPGDNSKHNIYQSMSAVRSGAETGTIPEESYESYSNAYNNLSLSCSALVSQAGLPRSSQFTQRNSYQHSPYGSVPSLGSSVSTTLPPRKAPSVNTAPSANLDRVSSWWNSSNSLVNDILQYAGVLSGNGEVEYSKLDKNLHILPEHDKDLRFYAQYAQQQPLPKRKREVIVIEDNSDEEVFEGGESGDTNRIKKARASYSRTIKNAMPPLHDTHDYKRQNGIVENNSRLSSNVSDIGYNGFRQDLHILSSQTSHLTKQTHRDSTFKVVIPSPNAKTLQGLNSQTTSHAHNDAVLDLADETPSATRTPNSRAGLISFPAQVRGSPAPASSTPYAITANGKKRGRLFATPDGAARAAKKVDRVIIQQPSSANAIPSGPLTINGKKRGRPFQTPEAATAAAVARAARENTDLSNAKLKKRGRPLAVNKEFVIPDGKYLPFLCEWKGCPAKLNNLNTLRLHLNIVHGLRDKATGKIPCRWAKCASTPSAELDATIVGNAVDESEIHTISGEAFKQRSEWKQHIEEAHFIPFSWHMGDGPADETFTLVPSEPSLSRDEPWLFDEDGKQVTPSVHDQRQEAGRASFNNSRRYLKQIRHMLKADPNNFLNHQQISNRLSAASNGAFAVAGSPSGSTRFDIVLPAVQSPHEFVAIQDSDSEDELAIGGHELGTNLEDVDVEMSLS